MRKTLSFNELLERRMFLLMGFLYLIAFSMTSYGVRSFNQTVGYLFDPTYYFKVAMIYDWVVFLCIYALIGLFRFKTNATLSKTHLFATLIVIILFEFQYFSKNLYFSILIISYLSFILNMIISLYRRNKI